MRRFHGFGFELAKFFGDEGLDFPFAKAEMDGFRDELLDRRIDMAATGLDLERGGLMGNVGAEATTGFDETFAFKNLINFGDGEGIDAQLRGEVAHRGKLRTVEKLPGQNALLELLL